MYYHLPVQDPIQADDGTGTTYYYGRATYVLLWQPKQEYRWSTLRDKERLAVRKKHQRRNTRESKYVKIQMGKSMFFSLFLICQISNASIGAERRFH